MRIALFDRIQETHVCTALARALRALGHEVVETGALWHGHRPPTGVEDRARIDAAIADVVTQRCDALFNFRASALAPADVARLRAAGVATAVWLPDDPVLYGVTYGAVVDAYDHVLHCGGAPVLHFYAARGHRPGVAFPFWVDPEEWAYAWSPRDARHDLVFLGNLHGAAKKGRYAQFAAATGRLAVYGKCGADPAALHRGELYGVNAMRAVLPLYRAGLNVAQRFADYAGTGYDFPGLAGLGSFDLPSRVLQYAAIGLPAITLGAPSVHFPQTLHAGDIAGALALLDDPATGAADALAALSMRARTALVEDFSAAARARFLVALFGGEVRAAGMTAHDREFAYRSHA